MYKHIVSPFTSIQLYGLGVFDALNEGSMISKTSAGCVPGGVPVFVFMQSFTFKSLG